MYQVSDEWNEKIYQDNLKSKTKIYINEQYIQTKIIELNISHILYSEESSITLGATPSKSIEIKLLKKDLPLNINTIRIEYGILIDDEYEMIPIGIFNVESISEVNDTICLIKAKDNMIKFEDTYDGSNLNYPATIKTILLDICNKFGVQLGTSSFLNENTEVAVYDSSVSARTYLSYIAEKAGCFAVIGRDGKLYLKELYQDSNIISKKIFKKLDFGERHIITGIKYQDGIRAYNFGTQNGNTLWINSNNMFITSSSEIENIYNRIVNFEAYSFSSGDVRLNPALDVGDKVIIDGKDIIYQYEMSLKGRFLGTIKSKLSDKAREDTTIKRTSERTILRRVQSNIDQIEGEIYTTIEETGEKESRITKILQDLNSITSKVEGAYDFTNTVENYRVITINDAVATNVLKFELFSSMRNINLSKVNIRWYNAERQERNIILALDRMFRKRENVADSISISDGKFKFVKRIDDDGNIMSTPIEDDLYILNDLVNTSETDMILFDGKNTIGYTAYDRFSSEINCFDMKLKYLIKNDITDRYAQKIEIASYITQHADEIASIVIENLDDETFGTKIVQNKDSVKLAWNQIGQNIKLEVGEGNNANLNIYDENNNLLMSIDFSGQKFYDAFNQIIGKMGIVTQGTGNNAKKYIAFETPIDFESSINNGFAWGLRNKTNNEFYPILYLKDFYLGPQQSDIAGGQLVLQNCGLVVEGGNYIKVGNVIMSVSDWLTGNLSFFDAITGNHLMSITPENEELFIPKALKFLEHMEMYVNQEGAELFRIGDDSTNSVWGTSNGYLYAKQMRAGEGGISTSGGVSAAGDISTTGYVTGHFSNLSSENFKKEIKKYDKSALKEILDTDIYSFLYKDNKIKKKTIGPVIGQNYSCSKEIITEDKKHIDTYSMISLVYKAIQEQQSEIDELKKEIDNLKRGVK